MMMHLLVVLYFSANNKVHHHLSLNKFYFEIKKS